jgi:hypothetical protein
MDGLLERLQPLWAYAKILGVEGFVALLVLVVIFQLWMVTRRLDRLMRQADAREDLFKAAEEAEHRRSGELLDLLTSLRQALGDRPPGNRG